MNLRLFLCGDVMTGRGIDQILRHPSDPQIHEPYVRTALEYVRIAEQVNRSIPRHSHGAYVWGDALEELKRAAPAARIVNLETAVTHSNDWADKPIDYRMNPANVECLTAAGIDCCVLGNNHVLDWGPAGLMETLDALHAADIRTAGAGRNLPDAEAPARLVLPSGKRVLVFSFAMASSGAAASWAARETRPGIAYLADVSQASVDRVGAAIRASRRNGDLVIASVHWGANWDYAVSPEERAFARAVIEQGADLFHGHSSHHPKGIELHQGKLVLYGCGDLINDYEGIGGYEAFRGDLGLMYFPELDAGSGALAALEMVPMQMRRFRACRPSEADARWLAARLERECRRFGTYVTLRPDGRIALDL